MRILSVVITLAIMSYLGITLLKRGGKGNGISSINTAERATCKANLMIIERSLGAVSFMPNQKKQSLKQLSSTMLGSLPACPKTKKVSYDWVKNGKERVVFCKYHGFANLKTGKILEKKALKKGLHKNWRKN